MPAGAIHEHHGMGAGCHGPADFCEMQLHGGDVAFAERQTSANAAGRADGTHQMGTGIALVGGQSGAGSRLAQIRVRPFCWPILASSWNQTSTGVAASSSCFNALK